MMLAMGASKRDRILALLAVLNVAVGIRTPLLGIPFTGNMEGLATGYAITHAVNLSRYGPVASNFAGVLNVGNVPPESWVMYAHHPPLVPILISGVYRLVGVTEWSSRILPALFSVATALLLYTCASRLAGPRAGLFAGVFYSGAPITVAYGGMPDYINAQLACLMLFVTIAYVRWQESGGRLWMWAMAIAFVLGALTDWPMFYVVPGILFHCWWTNGRWLRGVVRLAAPALAIFLLLVLWMDAIEGRGAFLHQFMTRASGNQFRWSAWFHQVLGWEILGLHTPILPVLSLVFLGRAVVRVRRLGAGALLPHSVPLLLWSGAVLHLIVGREGVLQAWWAVLVTAPLALTAALTLDGIVRQVSERTGHAWVSVIVALALFVACAIPVARVEMKEWADARRLGYELHELGAVIRVVSSPGEGVLTSDYFSEPALWFYANRQIRTKVVRAEHLDAFLEGGWYELPSGYLQPTGPPPTWMVMAPSHRDEFMPRAQELDRRFPRRYQRLHRLSAAVADLVLALL